MNFCRTGRSRIQMWRYFIFIITCLALLVLLAGSYIFTDHEEEFVDRFYLEGMTNGGRVRFKIWENQSEGMYYLFLPAFYVDKDIDLTIHADRNMVVSIDDKLFKNTGTWENVQSGGIYRLKVKNAFGMQYLDKPLQVLVSENLPAVFIDMESEDLLEQEIDNKKYIETGNILFVDPDGNIEGSQQLERFKIRGNLTATLEKKPYSFTLAEPFGVCGMASAKKWKLIANATDGSYLRNKIVLDMANQITDAYEPDGEFVDLFLNGEYQGMYLLTEGVELGENRLDVRLQGDWLLEIELDFRMEEDIPYVITDRGQIFAVNAPREVGPDEIKLIDVLLNDVESALYSEDGLSAVSGKPLEELIDMDSWTDAWLIQEISGDHDTGIASQFAYIQEDGRLYAGPVWDFDGTMGNVNTAMFRIPEALTTSIEHTRPANNANQNRWLSAMYRNKQFRKMIEKKYTEVFEPVLDKMCNESIYEYTDKISKSASLDALRWNEKRLSWAFVLPAGIEIEGGDFRRYDTLAEQTQMLMDFLKRKKYFLDALWIEHKEFCVVEVKNEAPFLNSDYNNTLYYWVEKGKAFLGKPVETNDHYEFMGYADVTGEAVIKDNIIIERDCILKSVWKEKGE